MEVGDDFGVGGRLVGVGVQVGGKRSAARVMCAVKDIAGMTVARELFPRGFESIMAAVLKIKQFSPSTKDRIVSCLEVMPKNRCVRLVGGISISLNGIEAVIRRYNSAYLTRSGAITLGQKSWITAIVNH
jgi:hypothetical protein